MHESVSNKRVKTLIANGINPIRAGETQILFPNLSEEKWAIGMCGGGVTIYLE